MPHLPGLGSYLTPPRVHETEHTPDEPCGHTLPDTARVAPLALAADLERLAAMIDPATGGIDTTAAARTLAYIRDEVAAMPTIGDEVECGYTGEVDAVYSHGTLFWTCPRCGTDCEEEVGD
jgi:hypothetical protein